MSGPRALTGLRHEPHGTPLKFEEPHRWVRRHIGVKNYCEHCLRSNLARYDLANKTGVYDRRPENWITLCRRCHIKFDSRDPKRPSMRGYSLDRQWVK